MANAYTNHRRQSNMADSEAFRGEGEDERYWPQYDNARNARLPGYVGDRFLLICTEN